MFKYKLLLPKMGESVAEATIIKWNKNVGDTIDIDDIVLEIATDKVDSEVPSPVKGKLVLKLCEEKDVVQVGALLALIEVETDPDAEAGLGHDTHSVPAATEQHEEVMLEAAPVIEEPTPSVQYTPFEEQHVPFEAKPEPVEEPKPTLATEEPVVPFVPAEPAKPLAEMRFYSPLVKNIAVQEGITTAELDNIPGTGAEGRLTKEDLLNYIQKRYPNKPATNTDMPQAASAQVAETIHHALKPEIAAPTVEAPKPAPVTEHKPSEPSINPQPVYAAVDGSDEIVEMDRMRRLIADHMVSSIKTSAHVTSFVEADVTNMVLWREKIKRDFEKREGMKITYTPIFVEAVVHAIRDFPMINVSVNGSQIIKKKDVNIGMATALPSGNLIVPVIHHADQLNIVGLTEAVNSLAEKARHNKLSPDEIQGGTFTITNIGTFGNIMGTPIINQPQVAILALGAIKKKPAVIETPTGDMIAVRQMMYLSMSYDHRVVDGFLGGSFLRRVADYLENWDINREI